MDVMENIEIELTDEEFLGLARQAHDLDITFNQLVNSILGDAIGIDPAHSRFQHTVEQIMATS
jgi:hypothetical protein